MCTWVRIAISSLLLILGTSATGKTQAEDEISFKSVRVVGTLKERAIFAWTPLTVDVSHKDSMNAKVTVQLDFGDNEKLKTQAAKLIGKRVVVEGPGEYRLINTKVIVQMSLFVVVEKITAVEDK